MRAVAIAEDRSLQPIQMEERALGSNEVRVDVAFCGICGSDIHMRRSAIVPVGAVMGHEFSGTVREVGESVEGFQPDDRVAVYPFAPCGECPSCERGDRHVCLQAAASGIGLGANPGAYAESVVAGESMLLRLPDELSLRDGALVEPLAVALHGIAIGDTAPDDACAVIGAGPIGVMTALALKALGVERLIVVERNEPRRDRMRSLGIEAIGLDDVHMGVVRTLGGEPPAVVFECAGHPSAAPLALEVVRARGIVVLLGVLEESVAISQLVLMIKEAQMRASFAYTRADFERAAELLARRRLPAAEVMITATAPLERAQEMFERLESPRTQDVKILLAPASVSD